MPSAHSFCLLNTQLQHSVLRKICQQHKLESTFSFAKRKTGSQRRFAAPAMPDWLRCLVRCHAVICAHAAVHSSLDYTHQQGQNHWTNVSVARLLLPIQSHAFPQTYIDVQCNMAVGAQARHSNTSCTGYCPVVPVSSSGCTITSWGRHNPCEFRCVSNSFAVRLKVHFDAWSLSMGR